MKNKVLRLLAALLGTWLAAVPAVALERRAVPGHYQWDPGGLFADEAQWVAAKDAVKSGRAAQGRDSYLRLLKAGSSKYPVDLLKDAGVDMSTSQPFDAAMREMNRIMDEIERIYARQAR